MKTINRACGNSCEKKTECIYKDLTVNDFEQITSFSHSNIFKKNQIIFSQGHQPRGVYCVNDGKVKIVNTNKDGKETIIRLINPGEFFGHTAILNKNIYPSSAIALEESVIAFYEKDFFLSIIKHHPSIALNLLTSLSDRIETSETNQAALNHKNVRERFASLLVSLMNSYGVKNRDGIKLEIKLTRDEMASMIGTTSESLVRLATEFKNEGIFIQEEKYIILCDQKKLLEFANI